MGGGRFHRKRDPFARQIDRQHGNLYPLLQPHHLGGVLDEAVGQFAHVHQAVLMDPDVHKRPESRDVGDNAGKLHSRLQILQGRDALGELEGLEGLPRVPSRFGQLFENVRQGRQADGCRHIALGVDPALQLRRGQQIGQGTTQVPRHAVHDGVALRVHRAGIQRVGAVFDPQKPRGLLKGLGAQARDLLERLAGAKRPVRVSK